MSVRIAFFGAGAEALPYVDALRHCPDARIIAVCDAQPQLAERLAAEWGATAYSNAEAMLTQACPDVLWACVPAALQGAALLQAADQRIPFFTIPPGAVDVDQARRIEQTVREAGLVTSIGYHVPYRDVTSEAKEYLGGNTISLALGWWIRPAQAAASNGTLADLLWNEGARVIDALRYFCGESERVRVLGAPTGNALVLHCVFKSGTVGSFTVSTLAHPEPRVELELIGDGWSLTFSDEFQKLSVIEPDKTTILKSLCSPREDHVRAFLEAVITGNPQAVQSTYGDALATMETCAAAIKSMTDGPDRSPDASS